MATVIAEGAAGAEDLKAEADAARPLSPSKAGAGGAARGAVLAQACRCSCCPCARRPRGPSGGEGSTGGQEQGGCCAVWLQGLTVRGLLVKLVFLGGVACFLAALLLPQPRLLAAGISAALGCLALYAHALQVECARLAPPMAADGAAQTGQPGDAAEEKARAEVDLAAYSRALVSSHTTSQPLGPALQSVLATSLVNEHLRCVAVLRCYQERYGRLAHAPAYDCSRAAALLAGLGARGDPARDPMGTSGRDPLATSIRSLQNLQGRPVPRLDLDAVQPQSPGASSMGPTLSKNLVLGGLSAGAAKSIEDLDISKDQTPMFGVQSAQATTPPPPVVQSPTQPNNLDDTANLPLWLRQIRR